jgi:hypothetical protein
MMTTAMHLEIYPQRANGLLSTTARIGQRGTACSARRDDVCGGFGSKITTSCSGTVA